METLFQIGYRKPAALRHYVRALTAADARKVAKRTWGANGTPIPMSHNWTPAQYGIAGYMAWVGEKYEETDTRAAAAAAIADKARRKDFRRAMYDPRKARRIARMTEHVTI